MALLQMQRIYIYALKKDRKQILELLQRRGVVEIETMLKEDSIFRKTDVTKERQDLEKNIETVNNALNILNSYSKEESSLLSVLYGRKELPLKVYESFHEEYETIIEKAKRIIKLERIIAENKAEVLKLQTQIEILKPWLQLDIFGL